MTDNYDDQYSMIPSTLDMERAYNLEVDGSMQSENDTWTLCRYPPKPSNPMWCEYSLLVNNPELPARGAPYELKSLKSVFSFLEQLDSERKG